MRWAHCFGKAAIGWGAAIGGLALLAASIPASGATAGGWPAYLGGPAHTSYDASETAITPASVPKLRQDWHFIGDKPTLAGPFLTACNKNGILYVLDKDTLKLVWSRRIGAAFGKQIGIGRCISATVYDGSRLYIGADQISIGGQVYRGSITALDPATGRRIWITGLPNSVLGTPSLDGAGVLAVGTYDTSSTPNAVYLINAKTGQILRTLLSGGYDFAQSAFAAGHLYVATSNGLYAFGLPK